MDKKIYDTKLDNFPELTEGELRDLTMAIYHLKHAKSYTDGHFDENGSYEIMTKKRMVFSNHRYVLVTHQTKHITCVLNTLKG